jgi:predicted MFS family arabinose efflux permease
MDTPRGERVSDQQADNPERGPERGPERSALGLVLFLLALHVVNQIDRQLIAGFADDIMRDLVLSRTQFALIAGLAFSGVYAVSALAAGLLADRFGRVPVLASGVGIWSLATALGGLARGFWSMLAVRPLVAAGEATLVPTATNIILARTPERHKSAAVGLFFAGIPLGVGGSFLIAGTLGPELGWRGCFFMMGVIGLIATWAVTRMHDPQPPKAKAGGAGPIREWLGHFRANPRLRWASLAVVGLHGHVATSPFVQLWLIEDKHLAKAEAGQLYGAMFMVFGLIGSLGAGLLADWGWRSLRLDRAWTSLISLALLLPLILAYRLAPAGSALFLAGMAGSILFMTMLYAPLFSVIEEQLPVHLKATSAGINMLTLNIVVIGGLSLAIGAGSEWLQRAGSPLSWTWPLMGADLVAAASLVFVFLAARHPRALSPVARQAG